MVKGVVKLPKSIGERCIYCVEPLWASDTFNMVMCVNDSCVEKMAESLYRWLEGVVDKGKLINVCIDGKIEQLTDVFGEKWDDIPSDIQEVIKKKLIESTNSVRLNIELFLANSSILPKLVEYIDVEEVKSVDELYSRLEIGESVQKLGGVCGGITLDVLRGYIVMVKNKEQIIETERCLGQW